MARLLGGLPGESQQQEVAQDVATLPMRLGGLGLRSASRTAPGAFCSSWAEALPMIQARLPIMANAVMEGLEGNAQGCIGELQESTRVLDASGFIGRPSWTSLRAGARPPPPTVAEPGEWQHGWQYYASSSLEHHFRETVVFAQSSAADLAHLSQAFAQAKLPEEIVSALRMGQMTALGGSEELLSATSSGGWWQKLLRSSSRRGSRMPPSPSNTHSRPEQGARALHTLCR